MREKQSRSNQIWVYTVFLDLSIRILKEIGHYAQYDCLNKLVLIITHIRRFFNQKVWTFFLLLHRNILEVPQGGTSHEYP